MRPNPFFAIRQSWGPDTVLGTFDHECPAKGHCAVTALVIQDLFGGDIIRAVIPGLGSHYWNRIAGMGEVDLTREQFARDLDIPRGAVVDRSYLLEGERAIAARTAERYAALLRGVQDFTGPFV